MARRYEFYVRVAETISVLPREHKIHIFSLSQRVMFFLLYGDQMKFILPIFISLFSKNRASFTNHRSSL